MFFICSDVSDLCKAKFLDRVGKRTRCFVRFSTVGGESGSADTARDPRGAQIPHASLWFDFACLFDVFIAEELLGCSELVLRVGLVCLDDSWT
jgi:hypothetical protein